MFKVGDKVRIIKDSSEMEQFKKYIGTIQEVESIYENRTYLKDIVGEVNVFIPRIFYYPHELELINNIESSLEHCESYYTEVNNEKISFNDNNGFKNIMIGNKAYSMENAKKLVIVLNEMLDKYEKMEYNKYMKGGDTY